MAELLVLFLCGDVMLGRGIDQMLPHPVDPVLYEPYVKDARDYVRLAEEAHGPVPRPVSFARVWGAALEEFRRFSPDLRIINLETSITTHSEPWPGKGIHYRMHPGNIPALTAAGVDFCALANNHVLDWSYVGLRETLHTLKKAGIHYSGAGTNLEEAASPAILQVPGKGRVLLFSLGAASSGIPAEWEAEADRAGVYLFREIGDAAVEAVARRIAAWRQTGDLVVVSIHWGPNWGYEVSAAEQQFARRLIRDAGVHLVHGHSSHHMKGIEVYQGKLILYGAGDFINDYEGIRGYQDFRPDLGLMYFASLDPATGNLAALPMTPTRMHRLQVQRASRSDAEWLRDRLNREGLAFGTRVTLEEDHTLTLHWE